MLFRSRKSEFGYTNPLTITYHKCFGIYATDFRMRSPSFLILIAAFWSRFMVNPQSHSIVRTDVPTKLCCANLRRAPPYGLRRKAGIHFITPTQPLKPLGKALPGRFCFCNNTLLPGCGTRVNNRHTGQHTSTIVNRHNAQL